jgi:glycosyltransferase involved in cell wall biosynthesis
MNILIYIPTLDQTWGGVRQYAIGLIRIIANDHSNKYYIYHNSNDLEVSQVLQEFSNLILVKDDMSSQNFFQRKITRTKEISNFFLKRVSQDVRFAIVSDIDKIVFKYKIDIIHCPYQYIPKTVKAKLILTQHDVQEIHFPQFFTAEERAHRATSFLDYLRRADKIVVSYKHIKEDLIKYFSINENDIAVILLDMSRLWFEKFDKQVISHNKLSNKFDKFIFYPANTWEHKNHAKLLKALAILREEGTIVNLICSGHQNKYYDNVLLQLIQELNLGDQVEYIGIVEEEVLYALYNQCVGVVIPTIYEAGSFPLMESILLNVPVICSNVTSLPETIGDTYFTFNPHDVNEIAFKVRELWVSEEFRNASIKNSKRMRQALVDTDALKKIKRLYKDI